MCINVYHDIYIYLFPVCESHDCCSAEPLVGASAPTHHWLQSCLLPAISSPIPGHSRNRAWHFTCWLCVSNFIIYAMCPYDWQKLRRSDQSSPFSGLDGATKTGPVTLMIFKRSPISLGAVHNSPSKSPVLPLEVIVPGWLGDRCQMAPPQLIHHAKQRRKADRRPSFSLSLSLSGFLCSFLLVCLFLVTLNNYIVVTSVCPECMFPLIYDKVCSTVRHRRSCNSLTRAVKAHQAASCAHCWIYFPCYYLMSPLSTKKC